MTILVTGAMGQLGRCIQKIATSYPNYQFIFASSKQLDITDVESIKHFFDKHTIDYCINCAAYTQVDLAEKEIEKARLINATALKYLSEVCLSHHSTLIHISTDYVFDGTKTLPYKTTDATNPINVYGATKLEGEQIITTMMDKYFIIRTSWVYSEFGKNFYKTIVQKLSGDTSLKVVDDQMGCPTNANDIAKCILSIIKNNNQEYGLYHFCGNQQMSWHQFAQQIASEHQSDIEIIPVDSSYYPVVATRPMYSVLDKNIDL